MELNIKTADRIMDVLRDTTGPVGRARKAVLQFRREPTPDRAAKARTLLMVLDENVQCELRQAARC